MNKQILEYMQSVVKEQAIELKIDSSMSDLIDSITFINLVVSLENKFGFEFEDEMLIISKFPTVRDMISYVEFRINCTDK